MPAERPPNLHTFKGFGYNVGSGLGSHQAKQCALLEPPDRKVSAKEIRKIVYVKRNDSLRNSRLANSGNSVS